MNKGVSYECAKCTVFACENKEKEKPENCPMRDEELSAAVKKEYAKEENKEFFVNAACLEKDGYGEWNRVRETIELCKRMGYEHIGIAFCVGLVREARIVTRLFEERGFKVSSVVCKNGANDKTEFGIPEEAKLSEGYEPACNPIGQATFLADRGVDFAIVLGLCVGHDSLFYKYFTQKSDAFCTTLVAKDRATGHNPCAAIYCATGYFKDKFGDKK